MALQRTMRFPGRFESLEKISQYVAKAAEEAGFDEFTTYNLQLAVDEACSNIIEHAYGAEDVGEIDCVCRDTGEALKITLKDWGRSFDPNNVPEPDYSQSLEKIGPRGAGLWLIKKIMDEVKYHFTPEGNELEMVKVKM